MPLILFLALTVPLGLDRYVPVPEDNPITVEKIALGRSLFGDRRLSRDRSVACTSCHDPDRAFSKPDPISPGVFGRRGRRNAPALINRAWGKAFFWDARVKTLEEQVLKPIEDPNEMDLPVAEAAQRVGLSPAEISRGLATYLRSIMSGDSAYDRYVSGDRTALTLEQAAGLRLFRGKGNCTACHVGPTFSDEQLHNTGVAWVCGRLADQGGGEGRFKTPSLREVDRTAPYMHDGSLPSLEAVVDFYDKGGNGNPYLDRELRPLGLSAAEKQALVEFLRSLNGAPYLSALVDVRRVRY